MATSHAFNERVEAALKKLILDEYPHMKHSSASKFAQAGSQTVATRYEYVARVDIKGIRSLRLTDLPRELRDRVYHYVVVQHEPIGIALTETQARGYGIDTYNQGGLAQPSITRVSKQMREESLKLFYKDNKFVVGLEYAAQRPRTVFGMFKLGDSLCFLKKWLESIEPANVNNINDLLLLRFENRDGTAAQTKSDLEACGTFRLPENTKEEVISYVQAQNCQAACLAKNMKYLAEIHMKR